MKFIFSTLIFELLEVFNIQSADVSMNDKNSLAL